MNFISEVISELPDIRLGRNKNQEVLRNHSQPHRYKEMRKSNKGWKESYEIYKKRILFQEQFNVLKKALSDIYDTTYEEERVKYKIEKDNDSKLNEVFFNQLKDNECSFENEYDYKFDGHNFRSRLEMIVAQKLKEMHMIYKYDCGINLYTKKCYGDMFIYFPEFNRCVCLEIMGSMDSADYISRASNKFFDYSNAGYLIGEDWFILSSTSHSMPNNATIEQAIINIVSVLCAKYVKEIV